MSIDIIKPLKLENPATGGVQTDVFPTETDPSQDYIATKGIAYSGQTNRLTDLDANGNLQFTDVAQPNGIILDDLKEIQPSKKVEIFDDFISNVSTGQSGWSNSTNGAGATTIVSTISDQNHPGIVTISKGTTATGRASLFLGPTTILLGGSVFTCEMLVNIPLIGTTVQDFRLYLGLGDDASAAEFTDGVYFVYDRSTSVNWQCRTASAAVRTNTITTSVVAAATYTKLKFVVNATGTSVQFFVNNTLVATNTTNIPITAGQTCGPFLKIVGVIGNLARQCDIDYYYIKQVFTTSR